MNVANEVYVLLPIYFRSSLMDKSISSKGIFLLILFHGGLLSFHTHITKIIIAERTLPLRFVKVNSRKGQNGKFQ